MLSSFQFKLIFILILIYTESKILNKKEVFYQTGRVGCKAVRICSTAVHRNRFCRCGGADVRHADQDGAWYRQRNLKSSMSWDFYISTFTNPRYPVSHKETKRGGGGGRIRQTQHERQFCRESDLATALYADFSRSNFYKKWFIFCLFSENIVRHHKEAVIKMVQIILKRQCHKIIDPCFFMILTDPDPAHS